MYSDIRFALRVWRRRPVLAAAAVLTLALGTGANTAIFSVIYAVMLKPLPYPEPARLVQIWSADRDPKVQKNHLRLQPRADRCRYRQSVAPHANAVRRNGLLPRMAVHIERQSRAGACAGGRDFAGVSFHSWNCAARGLAFTDDEYTPGNEQLLSDRLCAAGSRPTRL
jgi:hypothetical protein